MKLYLACSIAICFAFSIVSSAQVRQDSNRRATRNVAPQNIQESSPPSRSSKPIPKTVEIGLLGGGARVLLTVGDTLRVILPVQSGVASTGASAASGWQIVSNGRHVLEPGSIRTLTSTSGDGQGPEAGTVQHESLSFLAKAPGKIHLTLEKRDGEQTHTSSRIDVIAVTVNDAANPSGLHSGPVVIPAGRRIASYAGKLPCADCSGIRTRITLYSTGKRPQGGGYYVRTMTYLDAPHGDATFVEAGRWSVKEEQPWKSTLPNGKSSVSRVIDSFHSNTSTHRDNYERRGNTLVSLASDGKPIQSPFNMDLYRQP